MFPQTSVVAKHVRFRNKSENVLTTCFPSQSLWILAAKIDRMGPLGHIDRRLILVLTTKS